MDEQKSLDEDEMAAFSKLVELAKKPLPGLKDPRLEDGEDGVRRLYDGENLVAMGAAPEEETPVCTQCAMPGPGQGWECKLVSGVDGFECLCWCHEEEG